VLIPSTLLNPDTSGVAPPTHPPTSGSRVCVDDDMLTPTGYPPTHTAAGTAHSAHSTQPARLPPHRATPRVGVCVCRVCVFGLTRDREDASSMVTAGATANTTVKKSRASRESGLLCSHSHGESIARRLQRDPALRAAYMLNTRNEETNTVFYSYLACFVNTFTLNMYVSMAYTGCTRRNTVYSYSCGCVAGIRESLFNT